VLDVDGESKAETKVVGGFGILFDPDHRTQNTKMFDGLAEGNGDFEMTN
jgi:hypothetical protein